VSVVNYLTTKVTNCVS